MTAGARVSRCGSCGWQGAPERLWCPACGADDVVEARAREGVAEETTLVRRAVGGIAGPVRVGLVATDGGGHVVARLEEDVAAGARVLLYDDDGVAVARPI